MKLFHCARSRSARVLWLLEELELEYELEELPFDPKALKSVDYLELNPFGKVPVLVDGAVTMSESVAIVQYLLDRYGEGRFEPDRTSADYGLFLQWLHFGESTLMGPVAEILTHRVFLPEADRVPALAKRARKTLTHYLSILDQQLDGHDYLVGGEFTAADIVVGYSVFICDMFGEMPAGLVHLEGWYRRLQGRPAFKKATAG